MENLSTNNSVADYMEQKQRSEARIITLIAVVVLTAFAGLLCYMFLGNH